MKLAESASNIGAALVIDSVASEDVFIVSLPVGNFFKQPITVGFFNQTHIFFF
jgi:hypothetical protein